MILSEKYNMFVFVNPSLFTAFWPCTFSLSVIFFILILGLHMHLPLHLIHFFVSLQHWFHSCHHIYGVLFINCNHLINDIHMLLMSILIVSLEQNMQTYFLSLLILFCFSLTSFHKNWCMALSIFIWLAMPNFLQLSSILQVFYNKKN